MLPAVRRTLIGKFLMGTEAGCPTHYLQTLAPTLLVDCDIVRASTKWASRGQLSFKVTPIGQMARHVKDYTHLISALVRPDARLEALSFDATKKAATGPDLQNYEIIHF
jgi:hypothetical protein